MASVLWGFLKTFPHTVFCWKQLFIHITRAPMPATDLLEGEAHYILGTTALGPSGDAETILVIKYLAKSGCLILCQRVEPSFLDCRILQTVSKRALQWYSQFYCVSSVTKTFTLKGVQTIHRSKCWTLDSFYTFKCKCLRNSGHTATLGMPL
jgi:hypothetical protein